MKKITFESSPNYHDTLRVWVNAGEAYEFHP